MDNPFQKERRTSLTPGPDYSAKKDTLAFLKGTKKSLSDVNYTQAPYGSKDRCSECKFYEHPGQKDSSCEKVVGIVSGDATCDLFSQRDYALDSAPDKPGLEITIRTN